MPSAAPTMAATTSAQLTAIAVFTPEKKTGCALWSRRRLLTLRVSHRDRVAWQTTLLPLFLIFKLTMSSVRAR